MFSSVLAVALALVSPEYQHLGATPPPHGLPEIKHYTISATELHAGQTVHGTVETSDNVGYCEARINYRNQAMRRISPGKFELAYTVPWWLPPWLRHGYTLQIVARSVDGVETRKAIPITIH
jgi:hypothetical protein